MKIFLTSVLAGGLFGTSALHAARISVNSGSLGPAGHGIHGDDVGLGGAGPLTAQGDTAAIYSGGANTKVPFNAAVNPASSSPFTIEFWVNPSFEVNNTLGPSPLFNRVSSGNRSGWVFFQRSSATGFNFALYNGNGSAVGREITGGPYTVGAWNHVVAVWDGTTPALYVNGSNTMAAVGGAGGFGGNNGYNASNSAVFSIGAYDTGSNAFTGSVDETAFYSSALSPAQISNHYTAAANPTPGFYSNVVISDGAVLYLTNVPEPTSVGLMLLGLAAIGLRRRDPTGVIARNMGGAAV